MVDSLRYLKSALGVRGKNREFLEANPGFHVPPKSLAFDAYATPDWEYYHRSGTHYAEFLKEVMRKHTSDSEAVAVMEWGCGPGRVIRHFPGLVSADATVCGSDYNPNSIAWCREHIEGVSFSTNELRPPLAHEDGSFSFVYAISVFTHLSEDSCLEWMDEISRILRPGGVFFFTTHSEASADYLLPEERAIYETHGCCSRDKVKEGKKMFGSWHHPSYIKETLMKDWELLDHITGDDFRYLHRQDAWVARKAGATRVLS